MGAKKSEFVLCDPSLAGGSLLCELVCDFGGMKKYSSKRRKQFNFYLMRFCELFGSKPNALSHSDLEMYSDGKYKNFWCVCHRESGEVFSLYVNYGWWRIGGENGLAHLGDFLEFINPEYYKGLAGKNFDEVRADPRGCQFCNEY